MPIRKARRPPTNPRKVKERCQGSPISYQGQSTKEYVKKYFEVNRFFHPSTYIIAGEKVVA